MKLLLLLSLFCFGSGVLAQERVYQGASSSNDISIHSATWQQGDTIGLSWGVDFFDLASNSYRNLRMYEAYFDQNGVLLDTIRHDTLLGSGTWTSLRSYCESADGKVYKAYAGLNTDSLTPLSFVRVSENGQTLFDIPMPKDTGQWIVPSMLFLKGDTLMIGGQVGRGVGLAGRQYVGFWRDSTNLAEIVIDGNGSFAMPISGGYFNNKWFVGFASGWSKMLLIDDNLQLISDFKGHDVNPDIDRVIDIIPSHNGEFLFAPFFKNRDSWGITHFRPDFSEVWDTSFRLLSTRASSHRKYGTKNNLPASSYISPDSIFMFTSRQSFLFPGYYNSDSLVPLDVICLDTTGKVHWERLIGFGSNYIYSRAFTLQATKDGGVLLFADKYDPTDPDFGPQPHTKLAVIKIGGDGAVLHQREYPMPGAASLALFPNPTSDYLHFPRQGEAEIAPHVFVYSAAGESVALKAEPVARGGFWQMSVAELAPGSYWLSLRNEAGGVQTGYFVKQ